jgi:two-component system, OmpR family, phosphate regulon sensor histidine kinase PhoR
MTQQEPAPARRAQRTSADEPRPRRARKPKTAPQVMSLLQATSSLVALLNPAELFRSLIDRVVETLPAVNAAILWVDDRDTGRLEVQAIGGATLDAAAMAALHTCHLRAGEGLAGLTLQRGEPQFAETIRGYRDTADYLSPAIAPAFVLLTERLPRRLVALALPLRVGSETVGVLELISSTETADADAPRPLARTDIPELQVFANIAAAAIKNAQLYDNVQQSERRLKAFDAVVTTISTATDLHDLVSSVLDVVGALVPVQSGALFLLDTTRERLDLGAQRGLPVAAATSLAQIPLAAAPCAEVVQFGQPMVRPLLEERGELPLIDAGLAAAAYFPLLAGGTVAGVLALFGDANLPATVDREMLLPICNQVGFAVANVRLYEDSQAERRKLNTVLTSIAEGVLLCDARGRLTLANDAALQLLGLDSLPFEQFLADLPDFTAARDLIGQPVLPEALPFARALAGELFQDYRLLLHGATEDAMVLSFSGAPARAEMGAIEGAVVVFRDVTARQRIERAKDDFLAVAAHELRSPLAAVRSYADLLLRREQQRNEADSRDLHGLTILTQQVSHMLRMVDNLLDVSRIDAGQLDLQLQRVNLVPLVAQVIDQQRPAAGGRELVMESLVDDLIVEGDSLRIRQVLTNLVGNAIKYSPPDGAITVRIRRVASGEEIRPDSYGPAAMICVHDNGSGITPEQQARLFQRYYRVRNHRAEGLGLGLYLSRQFVQMHGGQIWVESVEGHGSSFHVMLPLQKEQ